jgi:hypothetical protein
MKRNMLATGTVASVVVLFLVGTGLPAQAAQCSLANVAGVFGYTSTGTIVTPPIGPFAAVGRVNFTSSGTLSGTQRSSFAGNQADETVSGTYSVSADCTGTATVNVFHGTTLVRTTGLNLVWDDNRSQIRAIFLTTGTVLTIEARRIGQSEDEQ